MLAESPADQFEYYPAESSKMPLCHEMNSRDVFELVHDETLDPRSQLGSRLSKITTKSEGVVAESERKGKQGATGACRPN